MCGKSNVCRFFVTFVKRQLDLVSSGLCCRSIQKVEEVAYTKVKLEVNGSIHNWLLAKVVTYTVKCVGLTFVCKEWKTSCSALTNNLPTNRVCG